MEQVSHKQLLLYVILGAFWLPLAVRFVPIEDKELKGVTNELQQPAFTWEKWAGGEYQKYTESYYQDKLGFRKAATRLANEIDYRLGVQRKYCIVGKQNELMGKEYIDSYYGRDYMGDDSINKVVQRISAYQKLLNDSGVIFFVVLAPSKVRLYPDRIPDELRDTMPAKTNYSELLRSMRASGVPVLDFQPWFNATDSKSPYALFSNLGVHWSSYAATLCADSLMGYIGRISGKPTNRLKITGVSAINAATGTDRDMLDMLNMYSEVPLTKPLGQIKGEMTVDTTKFTPSVLVVGDSYYWNIVYSGLPKYYFDKASAYYYYNSKAYFNNDVILPTKDVDVQKVSFTKDVVIWLYAEPNLGKIGNGIDQQLLDAVSTTKATAAQ